MTDIACCEIGKSPARCVETAMPLTVCVWSTQRASWRAAWMALWMTKPAWSTRTAHSCSDTFPLSDGISIPLGAITVPLLDVVETSRVLARDLLLHPLRDPDQVLPECAARVRPDAVRVRVVRAPDDVVLADERDDRVQVLSLLIGDEALAAEIVDRLQLEVQRLGPVEVL